MSYRIVVTIAFRLRCTFIRQIKPNKKESPMKQNLLATMLVLALAAAAWGGTAPKILRDGPPLEGTARLEMQGDITSQLVNGADRFLLGQIEKSVAGRARYWKRDFGSPQKYQASLTPNRERLAHILGVRDPRVGVEITLELVATTWQPALVGEGTGFRAYAVRWPAFGDVNGEGLLLAPTGITWAGVIALPDADQTPEQIAGLAPGVPPESQFARRLAESGCRVLIPVLVDRQMMEPRPGTKITNREFVYRSAFELGRHVIGYEVQKVLARGRLLQQVAAAASARKARRDRLGRRGHAGPLPPALDPRIRGRLRERLFRRPQRLWRQPVDRNVFGLLEQFGDAEVASLIAPRTLIVEAARGPEFVIPPGTGGAPGRIVTPSSTTSRPRSSGRGRCSLVAA